MICEIIFEADQFSTNIQGNRMEIPVVNERIIAEVEELNYGESYSCKDIFKLEETFKTHFGDKSNQCNQCEYATSRAGDLRKHLKIHSGEKSNKCNQCDYASSRTGDLRKHSKIHSGEKSNK